MQRHRFRLEIVAKFAFLELDKGFKLLERSLINQPDSELVIYERSNTKVVIGCSIGDGWGLDVLLEDSGYGEFSFHTYLRLVDVHTARSLGYSLAASEDGLLELINIYSDALEKHGCGLLSGDSHEWDRLKRAEEHGEGLPDTNDVADRFCEAMQNPSWE